MRQHLLRARHPAALRAVPPLFPPAEPVVRLPRLVARRRSPRLWLRRVVPRKGNRRRRFRRLHRMWRRQHRWQARLPRRHLLRRSARRWSRPCRLHRYRAVPPPRRLDLPCPRASRSPLQDLPARHLVRQLARRSVHQLPLPLLRRPPLPRVRPLGPPRPLRWLRHPGLAFRTRPPPYFRPRRARWECRVARWEHRSPHPTS